MTGCLRCRPRNRRCGRSAAGSTSAAFMSIGNLPKLRVGLHRPRHPRSTPSLPSSPAAPSPGSTKSHGCCSGCSSRAARRRSLIARQLRSCSTRKICRQPVRRVLELRLGGAQAAVKKIDALLARAGDDDRVRGAFRYHGAATGRWAGEGFQPQNLKRPVVEDLDAAIAAVATGDYAACEDALSAAARCRGRLQPINDLTRRPGTC